MVKMILVAVLLIHAGCVFAQDRTGNFSSIDSYVSSINGFAPDTLATRLTAPYKTELEKVRAIYSWISQNIAYNTGRYGSLKNSALRFRTDPLDTMTVWKPADEMVAIRVLHRRVTICEGYARLFKVMCDYAGLRSEIIEGYANGNPFRLTKFRCNHTWNAVMIDSSWYLFDVTWGSGYVNYRDEFVQQTDDRFFMADPETFIADHYPADLRWALLREVPAVKEFERSPFMYESFDKYSLSGFPPKGTIKAMVGDTLRFSLSVKDRARDAKISQDPFFDSTILTSSPRSVFLEPKYRGNRVGYTYVVSDSSIAWIHLIYNDDLVLRYRLEVRERAGMVNRQSSIENRESGVVQLPMVLKMGRF